ncbi:MAG: DUF4013 domain-containing protein [Candidatus Nanoarchaeia archaeon]|nr:DUF4013 domain-containing protein [Candidatus Nanoarchaeia archaeon]
MLSIDSAYKYLAKNGSETLIFCLLLALVGFIPVFGGLLITGLLIRIISNTINKKEGIPKVFGNMEEDLMNGLKLSVFHIIAMIPFAILMIWSFFSARNTNLGIFSMIAALMLPITILTITYWIIIPPLIANFAKKKKFSAFFEMGKMFKAVFSNFGLYLKYVGICVLYSIAVFAISVALSFTVIIPLLGTSLMLLVSARLLGEWHVDAIKK